MMGRARHAVGIAASVFFAVFVACSDEDVNIGDVGGTDAGPDTATPPLPETDSGPVVDAGSSDAPSDADPNAPECGLDGFCLTVSPSTSSPAGQGVTLNDVWIDPDGLTYAVGMRHDGSKGVILAYDGTTWTTVWAGVGNFSLLWGISRDEIWAAGGDNALHGVRQNGTWTWTPRPLPSQSSITGIWARSPNDAWACGGGGIYHWDGTAWLRSLTRVQWWAPNTTCGDIWGTETGELWASMAYTFYDPIDDYDKVEYHISRRLPDGSGVGDAGDGDEVDEPASATTDGWRIQTATRTLDGSYTRGSYAGGGVHRVVGNIGGRLAAMHTKLENGKTVFGPFETAKDSAGKLVSGSFISSFWATPTGAWGIGTFGVYRYDGTNWALSRTAIDGVPLIAIGQPNGIFGDATQVVVVGNNIALRQVKQ
jgi:hypothetical protein